MTKQTLSPDFQMDERNLDIKWQWKIVLGKMEKKFEISFMASRGLWIKGSQTKWKELPLQTMVPEELLRHGNDDKDL